MIRLTRYRGGATLDVVVGRWFASLKVADQIDILRGGVRVINKWGTASGDTCDGWGRWRKFTAPFITLYVAGPRERAHE
jgi:hypothetical protein